MGRIAVGGMARGFTWKLGNMKGGRIRDATSTTSFFSNQKTNCKDGPMGKNTSSGS